MNMEEVFTAIKSATLAEINELAEKLQDEFGVSPMMAAPAASAAPAAAAAEEEKTEFSVVISAAGDKKIQVIKAVRELVPELGLKEAKALVEATPAVVKEGLSKEDANKYKEKLEEAGAIIELK